MNHSFLPTYEEEENEHALYDVMEDANHRCSQFFLISSFVVAFGSSIATVLACVHYFL